MSRELKAAMILCAGFGTRMLDFTKDVPKPMLEFGGRPILEHTINHLSRLGISEIVINLHYLPDKIVGYFEGGKKFGVNITYSYEETPLGTAGAVRKASRVFEKFDDFLVLYGDVVCNHDYLDLYIRHVSQNALASIILHERAKSNSVVEIDENNKITRFIERPQVEVVDKKQNWVNSGLYCFKNEILKYIPENEYCDFPKNIFTNLVISGKIYGYPLNGYRCAVDSPERYLKLQDDFSKKVFVFTKYENKIDN